MFKKKIVLSSVGALLMLMMASGAQSALISASNGLGVYDNILDVTWTVDANINGQDNIDLQETWAAGLTIDGASNWRLASVSELIDLFNVSGISQATPGPFTNVQTGRYWSGTVKTVYTSTTSYWTVLPGIPATQGGWTDSVHHKFNAWAVADGDVFGATVPVPAAAWLFGSGLVGLIGVARRKARA